MTQTIYQVDAFTQNPFQGNPAGVCILPSAASEEWMQKVAREMNLSETAFLVPQPHGYDLRWFTPAAEVDLCGHATLASAHILYETGRLQPNETARFYTRSGLLTANLLGDWIELNFPATPPEPACAPDGLAQALGADFLQVACSKFDYLVELSSAAQLRALQPDITALNRLPVRGTIVTSRADLPGYDFISRFFAPAVGVPEDPVTGSAHCTLGPFWKSILKKDTFLAYQASARGGILKVAVEGERVKLQGQAVTVLRGELL